MMVRCNKAPHVIIIFHHLAAADKGEFHCVAWAVALFAYEVKVG